MRLKRVYKRIAAEFDADGVSGAGQVSRVSREGLFFCTESPPAPGTEVRVVLYRALGSKIEVRGTVRWNTDDGEHPEPGFGMRIEERSDAYLELYEELLTDSLG